VPEHSITAISFGEERPMLLGHDEESWRENRRDDVFVKTAPKVSLK
jgi:outer membrane protein OmpA-like peptidoglycan-associated protein